MEDGPHTCAGQSVSPIRLSFQCPPRCSHAFSIFSAARLPSVLGVLRATFGGRMRSSTSCGGTPRVSLFANRPFSMIRG
eukprot:6173695-Pleurochrysis_carterae.AAC.1